MALTWNPPLSPGLALAADTVGVRELRQNLSVYLERVKRGETLLVTEHRRRVAVLKPVAPQDGLVDRLISEGRASAAARPAAARPRAMKVRLRTPLSQLISDDRDDIV
jgi:prevent-host-death family protein